MEILIIGAGISGLSLALALAQTQHHRVTVLESALALAELGAGIQLTPIATKYFWRWGLGPDLLAHAALPSAFNVRDGTNGAILGSVDFAKFEEAYGAPYIVLHRADIHRILYEHAVRAGAVVRTGCRVVRYGVEDGEVELASGEVCHADLVVAADGIRSFARSALLPGEEWLERTGWAAYRVTAAVERLKEDERTRGVVERHECNCWAGDERSVMTYLVRNAKVLNVVLSHRDDVDTSEWTTKEYREEVKRLTEGWDESVRSIFDKADASIQNWPVYQVKSLPRWTSESGKFVLMGDAAHAMAFYLSMGVSMAAEDAAALVECLSFVQSLQVTLRSAMKIFETERKERAEAVRDASLYAGNMLHLPPGSDRKLRDAALRVGGAEHEHERFYVVSVSYGIADQGIRDWCYGYNVLSVMRRELLHNDTLISTM